MTPTRTPSFRQRREWLRAALAVGGGMAGATAAKYLRLWGNNLEVTLVAPMPPTSAAS